MKASDTNERKDETNEAYRQTFICQRCTCPVCGCSTCGHDVGCGGTGCHHHRHDAFARGIRREPRRTGASPQLASPPLPARAPLLAQRLGPSSLPLGPPLLVSWTSCRCVAAPRLRPAGAQSIPERLGNRHEFGARRRNCSADRFARREGLECERMNPSGEFLRQQLVDQPMALDARFASKCR